MAPGNIEKVAIRHFFDTLLPVNDSISKYQIRQLGLYACLLIGLSACMSGTTPGLVLSRSLSV